mmetsp:Transcript_61734/g.121237  ORF Transcript_61734/g.121237 Transcript_61734/m.121237 type:complete len:227 (+) Transcript_61734:761-1441(+)
MQGQHSRAATSLPVCKNWSPTWREALQLTPRNACMACTPTDLLPTSTHASRPPLNAHHGSSKHEGPASSAAVAAEGGFLAALAAAVLAAAAVEAAVEATAVSLVALGAPLQLVELLEQAFLKACCTRSTTSSSASAFSLSDPWPTGLATKAASPPGMMPMPLGLRIKRARNLRSSIEALKLFSATSRSVRQACSLHSRGLGPAHCGPCHSSSGTRTSRPEASQRSR